MNFDRFPSKRAARYKDVADDQWNNWRWQLSHRLNTVEEIDQIIHLTDDEREALSAAHLFRVDITPYFISLIEPGDPDDPVRKQVIPTTAEMSPFDGMMADSLAEDAHSPVPGLVHRYPDRVLMLVTTQCASYCRYCTRSRIVGNPHAQFSRADFELQLDYLRQTPQVRDVLLSGGDPLTLAPATLEYLLQSLRQIEHIEIIRIGSRVPVFMPMRIDDELTEMLARYHPLWMNIHVNHPNEITRELQVATDRLTRAGIPLGNQSVLLAGVNDCVEIQRKLVQDLVQLRVRPYYLYQCDLVAGAGHFRTPVGKGIEIIEGLRGHTSGYAVPTYVVDAPGGGGKIPLLPNYQVSHSDHKVVLRNYEGYITSYEEPSSYNGHDPKHCTFCQTADGQKEQAGVAGLLSGRAHAIRPQGFDKTHRRNKSPRGSRRTDPSKVKVGAAGTPPTSNNGGRVRASTATGKNGRTKAKTSTRRESHPS